MRYNIEKHQLKVCPIDSQKIISITDMFGLDKPLMDCVRDAVKHRGQHIIRRLNEILVELAKTRPTDKILSISAESIKDVWKDEYVPFVAQVYIGQDIFFHMTGDYLYFTLPDYAMKDIINKYQYAHVEEKRIDNQSMLHRIVRARNDLSWSIIKTYKLKLIETIQGRVYSKTLEDRTFELFLGDQFYIAGALVDYFNEGGLEARSDPSDPTSVSVIIPEM